jgi:hypothetical protein
LTPLRRLILKIDGKSGQKQQHTELRCPEPFHRLADLGVRSSLGHSGTDRDCVDRLSLSFTLVPAGPAGLRRSMVLCRL